MFEERRLSALPRIKRGESLSTIARQLGVSRQAVHQWAQRYRRHSAAGLRRRLCLGRPPKLARRQLAQLPRLLARGAKAYGFSTALWTTQRVSDFLWKRFQVRYSRGHAWYLLHQFGWSWQKPTGRARKRAWVQHGRSAQTADQIGLE
jgi:transposase